MHSKIVISDKNLIKYLLELKDVMHVGFPPNLNLGT